METGEAAELLDLRADAGAGATARAPSCMRAVNLGGAVAVEGAVRVLLDCGLRDWSGQRLEPSQPSAAEGAGVLFSRSQGGFDAEFLGSKRP